MPASSASRGSLRIGKASPRFTHFFQLSTSISKYSAMAACVRFPWIRLSLSCQAFCHALSESFSGFPLIGEQCPTGFSKSRTMMVLQFGTICPNCTPMVGSDSQLTSHRSVIELWDSRKAMADDVGAENWAVIKWWRRGAIPSKWWPAVLSTDKAKTAGVTADLLFRLSANETDEARA